MEYVGQMKIVAGMGSMEDYEILAKAGADEVFCGYVPLWWNEKYGNLMPLNRREVFFYHVQAGTLEDMKILQKKSRQYKVPVSIAMNALYYTKEQIADALQIIEELIEIGFVHFILADINLILQVEQKKLPCHIHISGELGEWNTQTICFLRQEMQAERIIFHRKNTIEDMVACIEVAKQCKFAHTYEAFFMNELCHYTGGFCNSLHCDEMVHLCRLPYQLTPPVKVYDTDEQEFPEEVIGETGCGLCAMWKLRAAGITHLKLVGRGKSAQDMQRDILSVKKARDILQQSATEKEYLQSVKQELFAKDCSKQCYFL